GGVEEDTDKKARQALNFIDTEMDSIGYAQGRIFLFYLDLIKARTSRLARSPTFIAENELPYRNWLSPRGFAFYIFSLYLRDRRDELVFEGDRYLSKFKAAGGRAQDVFIDVIQILLAAAKGQAARACQHFQIL